MNDVARLPERGDEEARAQELHASFDEASGSVDGSSSAQPAHAGEMLAAQREALSMSVDDIAARLKIASRHVIAIEGGRWGSFASPAILRGFVRAYAKAVQLDPGMMVDNLPAWEDPASTLTLEPTLSAPMPSTAAGGSSRWWISSAVIGACAIGIAIAIGKFGSLPADLVGGKAAVQAVSEPAPSVKAGATDATEVAVQSSAPAQLTAGATPAAPGVTSAPSQPASPASTGAEKIESAEPAKSAATPQLRINIEHESWVEVVDAAGRVLVSSLQPAGASQEVNGRAPLSIVIGNAPGVRVEYAGRAVDLGPYTHGNVARLALN